MSKKNNLHDYLADLYQGIASKKPNASKNPQDFRAEIEALGTIGGINGAIEQYTVNAGATVTAGDFVEFVNAWNKGEIISTNPEELSACKLDNTRVVIAYKANADGSTSSGSYALKLQVISIKDGAIVEGTPFTIIKNSAYFRDINVVALTDSRVVVQYAQGVGVVYNDSNYQGYVKLYSIEGNEVTNQCGEALELVTGFRNSDLIALNDKYCLSVYEDYKDSYSFNANIYLRIITCVDDSLIGGSQLVVITESGVLSYATINCLTKLSESKALLSVYHQYSSSASAYTSGMYHYVVGYENGVLSRGVSSLGGSYNSGKSWALDENTALYLDGSSYLRVAKIDGTAVTLGDATSFGTYTVSGSTYNISASAVSAVALTTNKALVVYKNNRDSKSYAVVATVDGMTVTLGEAVVYDEGNVDINNLIAFSDSSAVNIFANEFIAGVGMMVADDTVEINQLTSTYVQPATSRLHNVGVAKTGGIAGEKVEVYVVGEPSESEEDEPTDEDSIVGTWVFDNVLDMSIATETVQYFNIDFYLPNYSIPNSANDGLCHQFKYFKNSAERYLRYIFTPSSSVYHDTVYAYQRTYEYTGFNDENYRTVTIVGGADINNEKFLTWLNANATKIS